METLSFQSGYIWLFVIFLGVGIALTVRRYLQYEIAFPKRALLMALRILTLVALCELASEPALESYQRTIHPHTLAVLVDTSQSMQIREDGETRWQKAQRLIASCDLPQAVRVEIYRWDGQLRRIEDLATVTPDGKTTPLGDMLHAALDRLQHRRPATLLLISDGAHNQGRSPLDAARRAKGMNLPIHTWLVGGDGPRDVAILGLTADAFAFAGSEVQAKLHLRQRGYDALQTEVRLLEETAPDTWKEIRRTPVQFRSAERFLTIRWTPTGRDLQRYRFEIPAQPQEAVLSNNTRDLEIKLIQRRLRVAYLERTPRWDFRFLRNSLLRDPRIRLRWSLGASIRDFPDLDATDVLILGALPQEALRPYLPAIARFVESGGGLLLHPGMRTQLEGAILETLSPVRPAGKDALFQPEGAYLPELTAAGRRHPVSQTWDSLLEQAATELMALFHRYYRSGGLKPNAVALVVHPDARSEGQPMPLVAYQYYGKGRVLFVGVEELWRWRAFGGAEEAYHRLWSPMIQWLGLPRLLEDLAPVQLSTDRPSYEVGETISLIVRVVDPERLPSEASPKRVVVTPGDDVIPLEARADEPGVYEGSFTPEKAGRYRLTLRGTTVRTEVTVQPRMLEWRRLAANPDLMRQIAEVSGGSFHGQGDSWRVPLEPEIVERRTSRTLWDTPWALALIVGLLSVEWFLKRRWYLT